MNDRDIQIAWKYHNGTKHSYESVRSNPHYLDWSNQPRPYKVYSNVDSIPLPKPEIDQGCHGLLMLLGLPSYSGEYRVRLQDLSAILQLSAGITRRRQTFSGGDFYFRSAACTGALYEIELYVVCGDLEGLAAGVYLFSPTDSSLKVLRRGDYRGVLSRATAEEPSVIHADAVIVCTGTYWRNSWKYQARTYRHFGWDNGTILANLFAVANARHLPAKLVHGFADAEVNSLLDLDGEREVALNLIALGYQGTFVPDPPASVPQLNLETVPYSSIEVDYPAMREIHAASSLENPDEVRAWREKTPDFPALSSAGKVFPLEPLPDTQWPKESIEQVILRRGSSRQFARESITFQQLSTALDCALAPLYAEFLPNPFAGLNDLYVVAHAVDGLPRGAYFLHRDSPPKLELLKEGDFRKQTGYLGLEQELPRDCSAAVFFLAELNRILSCYGNRGYRAAQVEAGIRGGRLYLAAYALRFGATGLTFYDDDVANFFSPHAAGKSAIFLVALGKRAGQPFSIV